MKSSERNKEKSEIKKSKTMFGTIQDLLKKILSN